jgi:uncharacterized protein YuzE
VAKGEPVNVTYDRETDAAYIRFTDASPIRQEPLDDDRILDLAADGTLVGVDILSPSRGVDLTDVPRAADVARALTELGLEVGSAHRRSDRPDSRPSRAASPGGAITMSCVVARLRPT